MSFYSQVNFFGLGELRKLLLELRLSIDLDDVMVANDGLRSMELVRGRFLKPSNSAGPTCLTRHSRRPAGRVMLM